MDERLQIQITVPYNCKLLATDMSPYREWGDDLTNDVSIEFLLNNKETRVDDSRLKINWIHTEADIVNILKGSSFDLPYDGIWHYHKLLIPSINHLLDEDTGLYNIENETFYYNKEFYIGPINDDGNTRLYSLEEALSHSVKTTDYVELFVKNGSQTFVYKESLISACHLQKCLLILQKKLVHEQSCKCDFSTCSFDNELKNKCDFLLSALFVLDYLKSTNNYTEAQKILDNISTCESICKSDVYNLDFNSCGCGNSIR